MILNGKIIKGIGGFYYVEADGELYECKARGVFRKERITPLVGDDVQINVDTNGKNSIEKIKNRRNFFNRPPISNVDNLVIVSSTCDPRPNFLIIDRLTTVAVHKNVRPVIVFTKDDLYSAFEFVERYALSGIDTVVVSNKTGMGVDALMKILDGTTSVFTGNSGVGKSSLLNCIEPSFSLETGEISQKLGRGRHTTRHVELFKIGNSYIADTPGFSSLDFETNDIIKKDELAECFPEFSEYLGTCKFSSCSHTGDKGCKILEAVCEGKISESRYESYVTLYNEVKNLKDWQL